MKDKKDCWLKKVWGIQSFFDFVEFQSLISSTDFLSVQLRNDDCEDIFVVYLLIKSLQK